MVEDTTRPSPSRALSSSPQCHAMPSAQPLTKLLKSTPHHHPHHLLHLHAAMLKSAVFPHHPFPTSKLLAAAAAGDGGLTYTLSLFASIPRPNLFHHTTLLRALSLSPSPSSLPRSLAIFASARFRLPSLDHFAFQCLLALCAKNRAALGEQLHALALHSGFLIITTLVNALIHFYSRSGRLGDARRVFDEMPLNKKDAVSWSTLLGACVHAAEMGAAVAVVGEMRSCGAEVNVAAAVGMLAGAVGAGCRRGGESVHGFCVKAGFCGRVNVTAAMVTMYVKEGLVVSARAVFDAAGMRDLVLYNCMVDGYAKEGRVEEALDLVARMRRERMRPSTGTLVGLLSACASSGALAVGRRVHELVREEKMELDAALGTALVDMYCKSGCLSEAVGVFNQMPDRDVAAWTAMIMGFGVNGQADAAIALFHRMEEDGVEPNEVTFLAVFTACSHGGLVAEGKRFLERMVRHHGLAPKAEHYGCVIDLLGRAGQLEEAYELIRSLSSEGDAMAWRALLAACRVHGNVELGRTARAHLEAIDDRHPSDTILLSSTYASEGRWADIVQVRDFEGREVIMEKKEAGCSSIEVSC